MKATLVLYVMRDALVLYDRATRDIREVFPPNRARFDNPDWAKYLRAHKGLDYEVNYDLACKFYHLNEK